ncbi:hypothetical protein SO694_00053052 [Aureococcus anophagefferens]|uniref:Uncharacterized protein n=1 Tax=Aureococcus anophagefferens TaxID=44056 RepID=A0ABR1FXZ7_AURAN
MGPSSEGRLAAALELAATFLLEVLGGAGAVWGSSEFLGVRRGNNATAWRLVSGCVGLWCLLRWIGVHALGRERNASDEVLACFLLQVLGGAGAAAASSRWPSSWPSSPAGNGPASSGRSRRARGAAAAGDAAPRRGAASSGARRRAAAAAAERAATFVLDVGGGAGALWGAAEVCYLRRGWGDARYGQPSFDFWRYWCAATFVLCFGRWATSELAPPQKDARSSSTELTAGGAC